MTDLTPLGSKTTVKKIEKLLGGPRKNFLKFFKKILKFKNPTVEKNKGGFSHKKTLKNVKNS